MQINFDEFLSQFAPEFLAINVLLKNIMIKVNKIRNFVCCFIRVWNWPSISREDYMLRVLGKLVADEDNLILAAESRKGENCLMKRLIIWTLHLTFSGDKITKNGKGGTRGTPCREVTGFWWGNLRERAQFEERGLHWRIILTQAFRKKNGKL